MPTPPFSDRYQDVYFSAHGGLDEKRHVFMSGNDLPARFSTKQDFVICEFGFGAGLSFLATAKSFLDTTSLEQHLHFWSIEAHPMTPADMRDALTPFSSAFYGLDHELIRLWPRPIPGIYPIVLCGRVHLNLVIGDVIDVLPGLDMPVDAWYLDGFTPAKNPAMWGDVVFDAMARLSVQGASAATYSAARMVKDGLGRAGFTHEKRKGFGYKSDMIAAQFTRAGKPALSTRRGLRVLIHGGGLAGTSAAHAMQAAGHFPVIVAPKGLADAASGNRRGLYNPRFSAELRESALFYRAAFLRFLSFVQSRDSNQTGHMMNGALHVLKDEKTAKKFHGFLKTWGFSEEDAVFLNSHTASDYAGIKIPYEAVYLPYAGSVQPPALCALYAAGIEVRPDIPPDFCSFDAVVLASGAALATHPLCAGIKLQPVRGQVSLMRQNEKSVRLKTNLCYGGYVTPPDAQGCHVLGSTFQHWLSDNSIREEDHVYVRTLLHDLTGEDVFAPSDVLSGRASFRVSAPDRMPVIGPLGHFEGQTTYLSAAHGSHGLISTHLAGIILAEEMSGLPPTVPDYIKQVIVPDRFLDKPLKKPDRS